jgi:hypothetical protein
VLAIHALATCLMAGVVWFVQVVHYPLLMRVPIEQRSAYAREHATRTTRLVAPLMLIELTAALALVMPPSWLGGEAGAGGARVSWMAISGLTLLALLWASTFLVQVPLHARLQRERDAIKSDALIGRLVATNAVRTALWTARGVLAVGMVG